MVGYTICSRGYLAGKQPVIRRGDDLMKMMIKSEMGWAEHVARVITRDTR